ncbi:MAG: hypothetical protein NVSMB25_06840 [Thermoleophilaceae bacterium]
MTVPRPVLLALLGLALIAGLFVVSRGAQDSGGTVVPAPAPAPAGVKRSSKPPLAKPVQARAVAPHRVVPAHPRSAPAATAVDPRLATVLAAYQRGDVVVLFFSQGHSADDAAAQTAVAAIAHEPGVSTFSAGIGDLAVYRPLLAQVGVSQVPVVVVTRKGMSARLVEGFVDPGTLRQTVADARG